MRFGWAIVACIGTLGTGCTAADFLFGPLPTETPSNTDLELGISIVQPSQAITTAEGVKTIVQWADIATIEGTIVRVTAQRMNSVNENDGDPIELVGNSTTGAGRDALADGAVAHQGPKNPWKQRCPVDFTPPRCEKYLEDP